MREELTEKQTIQSRRISRWAYGLFLLLVSYNLLRGDIENATINLGIALIFDPFDPRVKWQDRLPYQRAWLLVHVALTFAGFFYIILR